jgi:TolB-like protein
VRQRTSWGKASISPDTSVRSIGVRSIAVLPFVNQSGNPDDEYFSDGMTDELATALMYRSRLPDRTSFSRSINEVKAVDYGSEPTLPVRRDGPIDGAS